MDMIDAPQQAVPQGPVVPKAQPIGILADLDQTLDDASVRAALMNAETSGKDPMTATMADLGQPPVAPAQAVPQELPKLEIPPKFLTPDGAADVEKIQASTKQLDEAIQKKEEAIKSVEDYLSEYREKENKFRSLPNAQKLAPPPPPAEVNPANMTNGELEAIIRQDLEKDPLLTMSRFVEIAVSKRLEPLERKEKEDSVRSNIAALVKTDSRVLDPQIFKAINAKLDEWKAEDPVRLTQKNPHRAAWLEVKEELRLDGSQTQAQSSRPLSPVLGGGTPPSTPSTSVNSPQNVIGNLDKLDLKDRRQEAMGDEAIKALLQGRR